MKIKSNDKIEFHTMPNGKYRASGYGKHAIGLDTPRKAVDAVVAQLSVAQIAERLYTLYGVNLVEKQA